MITSEKVLRLMQEIQSMHKALEDMLEEYVLDETPTVEMMQAAALLEDSFEWSIYHLNDEEETSHGLPDDSDWEEQEES